MMTTLEHVEKLRERADVTYEEAKEALDACNGDLLDAMIYLESKGKAHAPPGGGNYSSSAGAPPKQQAQGAHTKSNDEPTLNGLWRLCKKLFQAGMRNNFEAWDEGELWFSIPVILLVVLFFISLGTVTLLLVIGLFCGLRYRFSGRDVEKTPVNNVMDSASKAADSIKEEIQTSWDKPKE